MSKNIFRILAIIMILGLLLGSMGSLVLSFDSNEETIQETESETPAEAQ